MCIYEHTFFMLFVYIIKANGVDTLSDHTSHYDK